MWFLILLGAAGTLGAPLWLVLALSGDENGFNIMDIFWVILVIVVGIIGVVIYEPAFNFIVNSLSALGFENPESIISNSWKVFIFIPFWDWVLGIEMGAGLLLFSTIITLILFASVVGFIYAKYESWFDNHETARELSYFFWGLPILLLLGRVAFQIYKLVN